MRDSTFSSDFIALASLRQMVSPRPVCENSCARRPDSLRSGWNSVVILSCGMPRPLSRTANSMRSGAVSSASIST